MKTAGIDIGYGFLKIYSAPKAFIIPSVVGNAVDLTFDTGHRGADLSNLTVKLDGESYFVGDLAIIQSSHPYRALGTDRTTSVVTKLLFLTGLALLMDEPVESFNVVTGLPVKDYLMYKDTYKENFTGTHEVTLNGKKHIIHVNKMIVVPQPYGSFCDGLLSVDEDLYLSVDENFASNHIGVVDLGYGTSDFIQVKNYNYLERFSSSSANGISSVYRDISNFLNTKYGINKEDFELEEIIQTGSLKLRGKTIDIHEPLKEAKRSLAKKIATEIKSLWSNLPEISMILISGGGGALLFEELVEFLGDDVILAADSQLANVRGYFNWGVYLEDGE